MKKLFCLVLVMFFCIIAYGQNNIPFDRDNWIFESKGYMIENYKGYKSLYLQNGIAYLKDSEFKDGIIEFDVFLQERVAFAGAIFRLVDKHNYEEVYFRSHHSGEPDAFQYSPKFNSNSSWQLYQDKYTGNSNGLIAWKLDGENMGYNAIINFPFDKWLHVKMLVSGKKVAIFLDREKTPSIIIHELKREETFGSIGLRSSSGPSHFANFSYKKMDAPPFPESETPTQKIDPDIVKEWRISTVFKESELNNWAILPSSFMENLEWATLKAEHTGLVNISKLRFRENRESTVLAQVQIHSDKKQIKKLEIGFSDRARIYCNGKILYSGNKNYRSRDYRYLGTIGYFDAVYLPLEKGQNTLTIAVSESGFGWGLQAKLEKLNEVEMIPEVVKDK